MNKTTSAPKKPASDKAGVKTDEKAGIFSQLKGVLDAFVPPLRPIKNTSTNYEVISNKPIIYRGVERKGMYFGAVIIQKNYVGLYLMHVYMQPGNVENLGPDLRKSLKGKSCFHIKKMDKTVLMQVKKAVSDGIKTYKKAGFI